MVGGVRVQVRRSVWIHMGQHCHNSKHRPGRYAGAAEGDRWGEGAGTQGRQWVIGGARAQVRRGDRGWSVGRGCGYAGVAVDGRWGEGAGT